MAELADIISVLLEVDEGDEDLDLAKEVQGEPSPQFDFHISDVGSFFLVMPLTAAATEWLDQNIGKDAFYHGDALVVDHHYIRDIYNGIREAGLFIDLVEQEARDQLESVYDFKSMRYGATLVLVPQTPHAVKAVQNYEPGAENMVIPAVEFQKYLQALEAKGFSVEPVSVGIGEAEDDEETIKDILGADYQDEPEAQSLEGSVERHDRWQDVRIGDRHYCISYLTPVAVSGPAIGSKRTDRGWSSSTKRHIVKWLNEIGWDFEKWREVAAQIPEMPQQELIDMFKTDARKVKWSGRHKRTFRSVPGTAGLSSGENERVNIDMPFDPKFNEAMEDPDELEIKDVTEPGERGEAGKTTVKRHGRFKIVDTDHYTFLISYLTPVAYYDKDFATYYETTKQWSPTTNKHIRQWQGMIGQSSEWQKDERNWEPSEYNPGGHYVRWPHFKTRRQKFITDLFRSLMPTMEIKPHHKRTMYHVDPKMRPGAEIKKTWLSGHLKHHDSGEEGLPRPDEREFKEFFTDFDPPEHETWDWSSGLRDTTPYERGKPDEE